MTGRCERLIVDTSEPWFFAPMDVVVYVHCPYAAARKVGAEQLCERHARLAETRDQPVRVY